MNLQNEFSQTNPGQIELAPILQPLADKQSANVQDKRGACFGIGYIAACSYSLALQRLFFHPSARGSGVVGIGI